MTQQAIVLKGRYRMTGRLVEWLGAGRVIIECSGHRYVGESIEHWERRRHNAQHPV